MKYLNTIVLLFLFFGAFSQNPDDILFTVEDIEVPIREFKHIYEKTNGSDADYSEESVREYLDLYVNFKLKVKKARDMGLHENNQIQRELKGYRDQLASSYLTDKQIKDRLIEQVYERQQIDREVSHILISIKRNSPPSDTLKAYQRARSAYDRAIKGEDFGQLARQFSADQTSAQTGGYLGFLTAMLPNGFYEVENAIYETPIGQVSKPVRSNAGYHIIKVMGERSARGTVEIAHIFVAKENSSASKAKNKIDEIFSTLKEGADFDTLCAAESEDKKTRNKGGYIGKITIGQYEQTFEDAAFGLTENGDYSKPVETSVGWHIIKRVNKPAQASLKDSYRFIESQVVRDPRFEIAEEALIQNVRKSAKIKEMKEELRSFVLSEMDSTMITYQWSAPKNRPETVIVDINDGQSQFTIKDYILHLMKSSRDRVSLGKTMNYEEVAMALFDGFVDASCIRHEESLLEEKYPEFAALMKEYREGILLFEATKANVWDKASKDTTGIRNYFDKHRDDYAWEERAQVLKITVYTADPAEAKRVADHASTDNMKQLEMRYNSDNRTLVVGSEQTVERSRSEMLKDMKWEKGTISVPERQSAQTFMIYKILDILPEGEKSLQESRGYVVADYQDQLEKEWIAELKKAYKVKINERIVKKLIQG